MKLSKHEVFEELEPPPGGLALLRARIGARQRRSVVSRALLPMSAALAAATVITVWLGLGTRIDRVRVVESQGAPALVELISEHPVNVALGVRPDPVEPVVVPPEARQTCAVARVTTPDDEVIFYWVTPSEKPETGM